MVSPIPTRVIDPLVTYGLALRPIFLPEGANSTSNSMNYRPVSLVTYLHPTSAKPQPHFDHGQTQEKQEKQETRPKLLCCVW